MVIPDGQASATVTVTPVDDSDSEGDETVELTLASGTGYTIGSPGSDTVTIADNDTGGGLIVAEYAFTADATDSVSALISTPTILCIIYVMKSPPMVPVSICAPLGHC